MLSEADRKATLRALGQPVEINGRAFDGLFRDRFQDVDTGDRIVAAQLITLRLTTEDSAELMAGDPVRIAGRSYRLEPAPEHDVAGFTTWQLTNAE